MGAQSGIESGFRLYGPTELGRDGYPPEWHSLSEPEHSDLLDAADMVLPGGIKDVVRALAGHRCVRCGHPYRGGGGEWSPCDFQCTHGGPVRIRQWGVTGDDWRGLEDADVPRLVNDEADEVEARWRILTVHHLDGNKANCRWWNLCALDQRCHLQVQGRVQMARVWPWEHSEWFRPYVAGYYAHVYLGEDLTRQEVVSRLDELLALERAA